MIYLEPIGGLCNRMRAIDSIIPWCKKYDRELTIIWNIDDSLNAPFESLFKPLKVEGVTIQVLNYNASKSITLNKVLFKFPRFKKQIFGVSNSQKIVNDNLFQLYGSSDYLGKVDLVSEVDALFYPKIAKILEPVFRDKTKNYWIESCYRMHEHDLCYSEFTPIDKLMREILVMTGKFEKTVGLHIRRSDHGAAKAFSTTDKFRTIIGDTLKLNPSATIFISTDEKDILADLRSEFGDRIFANDFNSYNRADQQAIESAVIDLYCLAGTEKIFGSYFSSFSQVAADINKIPEVSIR